MLKAEGQHVKGLEMRENPAHLGATGSPEGNITMSGEEEQGRKPETWDR